MMRSLIVLLILTSFTYAEDRQARAKAALAIAIASSKKKPEEKQIKTVYVTKLEQIYIKEDPNVIKLKNRKRELEMEIYEYRSKGFSNSYISIFIRLCQIRDIEKAISKYTIPDYIKMAKDSNKTLVISIGCKKRNIPEMICCTSNSVKGYNNNSIVIAVKGTDGNMYCIKEFSPDCPDSELEPYKHSTLVCK